MKVLYNGLVKSRHSRESENPDDTVVPAIHNVYMWFAGQALLDQEMRRKGLATLRRGYYEQVEVL